MSTVAAAPVRSEVRAVRVGVVASSMSWRSAFVAHAGEHDGRLTIETIRDPNLFVEQSFDVLVVDDTVPFAAAVLEQHGARIPVIGVYHAASAGAGRTHLVRLGVDGGLTVNGESDATELVELLLDVALELGIEPTSPDTLTIADGAPAAESMRFPNVLGVGGPDAALACEVSTGIAHALSDMADTALIDLEPSRLVAARLGVNLQPNICDAVAMLAKLRDANLAPYMARRSVSNIQLPFATMPAAPTPERQAALSGVERDALIVRASEQFEAAVVTLDDPATGSVVLGRCSQLLIVADTSPSSIPYLLDWVNALFGYAGTDLPSLTLVTVGDLGRSRRTRLHAELVDCFGELSGMTHEHLDVSARRLTNARWRADLVRGPFRRACRSLVLEVMS